MLDSAQVKCLLSAVYCSVFHDMGFDGLLVCFFFKSDHCQNNYKAVFSYLFADQLGIVLLFYMGNVIPAVTPLK